MSQIKSQGSTSDKSERMVIMSKRKPKTRVAERRPIMVMIPSSFNEDQDTTGHHMTAKFNLKPHNTSVKTTAGFHPVKKFFLLDRSKTRSIRHRKAAKSKDLKKMSYYEQRILDVHDDDLLLEGEPKALSPNKQSTFHLQGASHDFFTSQFFKSDDKQMYGSQLNSKNSKLVRCSYLSIYHRMASINIV